MSVKWVRVCPAWQGFLSQPSLATAAAAQAQQWLHQFDSKLKLSCGLAWRMQEP